MFFRSYKFEDGMKSHSLGISQCTGAAMKPYKGDNQVHYANTQLALLHVHNEHPSDIAWERVHDVGYDPNGVRY